MNSVQDRLEKIKTLIDSKEGERNLLISKQSQVQEKIRKNLLHSKELTQARELLELVVKSVERSLQSSIEPMVSEGLNFVFNQNLSFHTIFVPGRRNQIEIDFIVLKKSEEEVFQKYISNPIANAELLDDLIKGTKNINYTFGGAVNQVISLMLRFIVAELVNVEGPIALDEPSSYISEEVSAKLGQLITSLSERFERQYILITHSTALAAYAEKNYRVKLMNYISKVSLKTEA
jgi:ABC-type dipeptide/oligopeptide/nickel transport system ATPase subunit